jgi:hypothetical protein
MTSRILRIAAVLLLASIGPVQAAPNIPSSELPGRERYRFQETPLDRFMTAPRQTEPLIEWKCDERKASRRAAKRSKRKGC